MAATVEPRPLTNATMAARGINMSCVPFDTRVASKGIFLGENPMNFTLPLLIVQLAFITFLSGTFRVLLKPLKQPTYVADILGGIALGPSFLGHSKFFYDRFFSPKSQMILDIYELLGILLFTFLVGLRTDVTVVKKAGTLALVIGVTTFLLPLILTKALASILISSLHLDEDFQYSLTVVSYLESAVNFHAIYSILTEFKLLNSELGRLALSSSMISSLCAWFYVVVIKAVIDAREGLSRAVVGKVLSRLFLLLFVMCACRPLMFWMIRKTPEGKTIKESYVCTLTLIVLGAALYCEVTGIESLVGAILLGMAVPGGPPLGSGLVDKLECFVSAVLLPSFLVNLGKTVDVYKITLGTSGKVELFIICGFVGKVVGTMVPSVYANVPVVDAFLIGLLMSCQGFIDVQFFNHALRQKFITEETFSIMVVMATLQSAIITPLVRSLYDPSRRYSTYKRRTIQHSKRNTELRILACIHQEENVPTIINILEASNPTRESPIAVYVVELVELVGQAMPLLINRRTNNISTSSNTRSDRIVRAFRQYEIRNKGFVTVQCFTSIAPFKTIHDDICSLALDKNTSLVIVPFQKSDGPVLRAMQKKVMQKAPCSVGILIDRARRVLKLSRTMSGSWFTLHLCVIFLGGPDDREALAYATRMAEHPNVTLTVVRIFDLDMEEFDLVEAQLDLNAINDFRIIHMDNRRTEYKEEGVKEGPETAEVLHSLSEGFDLMLVGRRHADDSPLLVGLSEWCEIRELGVIGDMITSSDYKSEASVLVVQQQASVVDDIPTETTSIHLTG